MPAWLIDLFANREINRAFWFISLIPGPVWLLLLFFPRGKSTRWLTSPFLLPTFFALIYVYFMSLLYRNGIPMPEVVDVRSVRSFVVHPLVFLVIWCHLMLVNLFVGLVLFEDSRKNHLRIPVELLLCWFFAPLSLVIYTVRRSIRGLL